MLNSDDLLSRIADALLTDNTRVFFIGAAEHEYICYSRETGLCAVHSKGDDFFAALAAGSEIVLSDEDRQIFADKQQTDSIISNIASGSFTEMSIRAIVKDACVHYSLRLLRGIREDGFFILGLRNIDSDVYRKENDKRAEAERMAYDQIAHSLAVNYDTIYYINMNTEHYFEFSTTNRYDCFNIPKEGDGFFAECAKNRDRIIYPDDRERVMGYFTKENLIKMRESRIPIQYEYRILVNGNAVNVRYHFIAATDNIHAIICIENIDEEVAAREKYSESQRKSAIYANIAESLASHYDVIFYVNSNDGSYIEFNSDVTIDYFALPETSSNFFEEIQKKIQELVYPKDRERMAKICTNESIAEVLENKKQYSAECRFLVGGKPSYIRATVTWASDRVNYIIGIENIDGEKKKEREQKRALDRANELARSDSLTGIKNGFAYRELEKAFQKRIDSGAEYIPFALAVCDLIGLKAYNKQYGKEAGNKHICAASRLICNVFKHSPVYRIDGGKFAVFLTNTDFLHKESLFSRLQEQVKNNLIRREGPVLACGLAAYESGSDKTVSDVYSRADSLMNTDKTLLKSESADDISVSGVIPDEEKRKLSTLFNAFSLVSDNSYIYICDMRYDFSKWSKRAVELFGLPSEYMYGAGAIWENVIHPDDKETYRSGISDIFTGNASGHDMQYRARKKNGEYDVCTCRGIVLRDENGRPEYFCGSIRNHSIQEHIDSLTGLRNQYGFFEDLRENMASNTPMRITMISINKFSEINEVYGYQFGNVIIQKFGRYLFEHVSNTGHIYRLDGTKFAVISMMMSPEDIREAYEKLREHFRKGMRVDGKFLILALSAGLLSVDNFDIDYQTVYACLNFAYNESKVRRHGELVEFFNDLNADNKYRLEKLHVIRASIMQNYKGFYLMYQPVVDASTEQLVGAEALLRWRSDEYGIVPPDHFIPILERDPLFCELGQWILRTAINAAKIISEGNPDFIINVNLSYTQLEKPDFVDMVLRTLKEEGFPPEHLCLEITERCRLLDMNLLKNVVASLRSRGILIALDDFGTGFSSIGIVKNLPFDTIKIDRSFVRMIEQDKKERELIKSFVGLAATFGAKICVEGVETAGMRDILQQYNIQSFQGYYYGKPLEIRDFILWRPDGDKTHE